MDERREGSADCGRVDVVVAKIKLELTRLVPGFEPPPEDDAVPVLVEDEVGRRMGTVAVALYAVKIATR